MRRRVWQVTAGGPRELGAVLAALGDVAALEEGRVFVDGRRAREVGELPVGARVEVFVARALGEPASVVDRFDGFVVALKPAALPTEPDHTGHASLVREVAARLGVKQLHAVSRLDVGVSGLVLLSETPAAHRRAQQLKAAGRIARRYLALAERAPEPERGAVRQPVGGRAAATRYTCVCRHRAALLALDPETGRKHQLRLHMQALGAPLLGDRAHGGAVRLTTPSGRVLEVPRVMLHAARLELPGRSFSAPPPDDFRALWLALGGAEADLERAITV